VEPLIQMRNLEKAFEAGGSKFFVLRRINIDIQQGSSHLHGSVRRGEIHAAQHYRHAR